jgi:tetratricopeptide (TPR) repeat protein
MAWIVAAFCPLAVCLAPEQLELRGKVLIPEGYRQRAATVSLAGVTSTYLAHKQVLHNSGFKFSKLPPGPYTIAASVRGLEELRQTIEISPALADPRGRVFVELRIEPTPRSSGRTVSVRQLALPGKARDLFRKALDSLGRRDAARAITLLEQAIAEAPRFVEALNTLGTIYNQKREYAKAEGYFREALRHEPEAFAPLVNLGGVLLAQRKYQEALRYNREAAEMRPNDALARCQLGWVYLHLDELERAATELQEAKRLDPGHFSRPQLGLASIHARRAQPAEAIAEMEDYLRRHPDDPDAPQIRDEIARLKGGPK